MLNLATIQKPEMPFDVLDTEQGTDAWLQLRNMCVGASDIPIIMGVSPHKGPYELWLQKTRKKPEEDLGYPAQRGKALEPLARHTAELHFETRLESPTVARKDVPWALASLDGANHDFSLLIEIKSPMASNFNKIYGSDEPPIDYVYQCQWQMYVTGAKSVQLMLFSEEAYKFFEIKRNDILIQQCYDAACDFRKCVLMDIAPEHDIKTMQWMDEDPEFMAKAAEYGQIKAKYDAAKADLDAAKKRLLEATDGGNCESSALSIKWSKPGYTVKYQDLLDHLQVDEALVRKFSKPKESYPTITFKKK